MSENNIDNVYDAVVIGGGPAGLTAALYLARARYRVLVVEREHFGGQITITSEVVNYPGVLTASGEQLTDTMRRQAEAFGAEMLLATVESLDLAADVKVVHTSRGDIRCLAVLLATGASPRSAGFEGEEDFRGHGVAYCATCDGEFFTGREVFVVGGGFAAAEEAVFLTTYASHVTILVYTDDFTCAKATADAAYANEKITVRTNAQLLAVEGDSVVRGVRWLDRATGEEHEFSSADGGPVGVFVFVGYAPATSLVAGVAELDPQGYVITDDRQMTSVDGLFAAGDVCQKRLRQVATAVGEGAATATEMERYLKAARERTGIMPKQPASRTRDVAEKPASTAVAAPASTPGSPIDDAMAAQLQAVFSRMQNPLVLRLHLDGGEVSAELRSYMDALAAQTELLRVEEADASVDDPAELPFVEVVRADGTPSGLAFHGVPGGHEFTSFVLGLYNASGPGQPIADADRQGIADIARPVSLRVLVGLSCTMCPDVVVACQRMAADNPLVTANVYDVNRFPELRERYDVMSVPCLVIDDGTGERVSFGKKGLSEILALVG
ncbi:thioredoxin reductase [Tractidigestivibacter scatoligenes]|uniref:Thioredoxin reductase n=1 Tax=Tractidigestivibacter scatoligenes TaxID=1299998 RepID=A0A100YXE6_TRASO|nr:FAD-dependent oxidoreductase [Tractidigestivibacter scatoligenes]KUH59448.1 thioredoxin reductase [Tractidigestivibacter scatoligenes]